MWLNLDPIETKTSQYIYDCWIKITLPHFVKKKMIILKIPKNSIESELFQFISPATANSGRFFIARFGD